MKSFIIIFLLVAASLPGAWAQSPDRSGKAAEVSSFGRLAVRYKSDYYYMGRADSAKAPYLVASAGYYHKSGLFASGSVSYLVAADENRADLFTLAAGYDYFGDRFAAGIAADQYFFSDESYAVQAEMSTYLSGYMGYDLDLVTVMVDASLGLSESVDFFLGAEISRTFYALKNKLLITPLVYSNMGTQHYYNEYYTTRSLNTGGSGKGGKGKGSGSGGISETITDIQILESEKFQVLDYEAGLQVVYKVQQLAFLGSATALFPVNPSTVVADDVVYEEDLDPGFVWSAGIRYTIR